jgi:glycosyltransferase involved in cell wall biosynthesis
MDRICMHSPSALGGQPLYVRELMTALVEHPSGGDRFEWVAGEDLHPQFKSDLYPVHAVLPRLPHKNEFRSRVSWAANRIGHYPHCDRAFLNWLERRPDITAVHFQEFSRSQPSLFRSIRQMGKKIFYTVHNIRPHAYPPLVPHPLWDRRARQACKLCDALFVHTPGLADELSDFLGEPHPPIEVTPHGVWTVREPVAMPLLEERLSWKRLLFFGTIRRNKGLDLLLRAAELLRGYSLTIAGMPREAEYFRNEVLPQVKRLRKSGVTVDLIDQYVPDDQVGPLFARHSAIVLPYTRDFTAQSGIVFVALAHELPVVASEAGGLRDLFEQFAVGVSFADPTPKALASAIHELFDGPARESLAGQIRLAKSRFSWHASAGATINAYMNHGAGAAPARTAPALSSPALGRPALGPATLSRTALSLPVLSLPAVDLSSPSTASHGGPLEPDDRAIHTISSH